MRVYYNLNSVLLILIVIFVSSSYCFDHFLKKNTSCFYSPPYIFDNSLRSQTIKVPDSGIFDVKLLCNGYKGYFWYIKSLPNGVNCLNCKFRAREGLRGDYILLERENSVFGHYGYLHFKFEVDPRYKFGDIEFDGYILSINKNFPMYSMTAQLSRHVPSTYIMYTLYDIK